MRLFVNVYHPHWPNTVYDTRAEATVAAAAYCERPAVEIEYDGDRGTAQAELSDFSAEGLYAHYPLPVVAGETIPTISVSIEKASDAVTVGDLNSSARGTGARKSAGKPDWSQLPWWVVKPIADEWATHGGADYGAAFVLEQMAAWQRGDNHALIKAALHLLATIRYVETGSDDDKTFPWRAFESTVRVLEFGAKKYAKGNWAKGMSWSVCFTCTLSHLTKALAGEEKDEESGISHLAHAMCNIVFLIGYRDLYPEGDDRLPEFRPTGVAVDRSHD